MNNLIKAIVIADSVNQWGNRITTFELTMPRIILAEFSRHRMFSFNSASSRAVPFEKMVKSVEENMFVPLAWQFKHSGMQGTEYIPEKCAEYSDAIESWTIAANNAIEEAKVLHSIGVTKQLCSRLLEPFSYIKVLLTATEFENFFELRCPKYQFGDTDVYCKSKKQYLRAYSELYGRNSNEGGIFFEKPQTDIDWLETNKGQAEIHISDLAEKMWDAINESKPQLLKENEWHIPYKNKINSGDLHKYSEFAYILADSEEKGVKEQSKLFLKTLRKVAVMMCARVSYTTIDTEQSEWNIDKYVQKYDELVKNGHMSPTEHIAKCQTEEEYESFLKGKVPNEQEGWCNNVKGWISQRWYLENE